MRHEDYAVKRVPESPESDQSTTPLCDAKSDVLHLDIREPARRLTPRIVSETKHLEYLRTVVATIAARHQEVER
jgi:hypothetical protein